MFRTIRFTLIGFAVLALCTACGGGGGGGSAQNEGPNQDPPTDPPSSQCPALPASTQPSESLAGIVDAAAAQVMKTGGMPGMTVAVAKNGTILYAQGYGYADLATCRPMQATDPMQIGSITKQITAAAVLQLQEAGLVDIDRSVASYLPDYAFDPRITLRMLLNQSSGLQDYLEFPDLQQYAISGAPQSTVLNAVVAESLLFEPGTAYSYSNSNYYILGSIIESVSSQTYPDYLAANIYPVAGLTHTSYLRPDGSPSPYAPGNDGPVSVLIPHPSAYFSAGQLWSTVQDLALWDAAWLSGKVVSQASIELMMTAPPVPYFQETVPSDYGMGWHVSATVLGHPMVGHAGQSTAYTGFNGLLVDNGLSVTALTNYKMAADGTALVDFGAKLMQTACSAPGTGAC
jgi:CubicO group peptidase (beta-lactamase class C family)